MKTNIAILKISDWAFKADDGKDIAGSTIEYLTEDYDYQKTSVKDEVLALVKKTQLPALFEVDVKPVAKTVAGKSIVKYEIKSAKLINAVKVF